MTTHPYFFTKRVYVAANKTDFLGNPNRSIAFTIKRRADGLSLEQIGESFPTSKEVFDMLEANGIKASFLKDPEKVLLPIKSLYTFTDTK